MKSTCTVILLVMLSACCTAQTLTSFGYSVMGDGALFTSSTKQAGAYTNSNGLTINPDGSIYISSGGSTSAGIVTTGLMAQYAFTEGSGTTLSDSSGNNNTATFSGGGTNPTWTTTGLSFNGTSNYVLLPQALSTAHTIQIFAAKGPWCDSCTNVTLGTANWFPLVGTTGDPSSGATHGLAIAAFTNSPTTYSGGTSHIGNGAFGTTSLAGAVGNHLFTSVLDAATDHIYFDNAEASYGAQGGTYGIQLASQNYTLGGYTTAGEGYFKGIYYYALFYSSELTAAQVAQNYYAILSIMQARGVQTTPGNSNQFLTTNNQLVLVGDSITAGLAGTTCCTVDTYTVNNFGFSGAKAADFTRQSDWRDDGFLAKTAAKNIWAFMIGTNAAATTSTAALAATQWGYEAPTARNRKASGWKMLRLTIPSITGGDSGKNFLNNSARQLWPTLYDGFVDIGASQILGADGANANPSGTYFNGDGVHLVTTGDNIISNLLARGIDRLWACKDFSCANTYTTTAPAATAITATSESGAAGVSIATITSTLNPPVGSDVTIAGVTPSGYNTSTTNKCYVVTTSAPSFTCYNGTSGLGVGTVFGTAKIPTQLNQDVYVNLAGSATSPSFTLQSCVGYTGQNFYFKNLNTTSPWVLTPYGSETIDGAASLTMPTASSGNNPVVILQSVLVSASAGGCNWKRVQ